MSTDATRGEDITAAGGSFSDRLSRRYFLVTLGVFFAVGIPAYFYLVRTVETQYVDNYSDFSINSSAQIFEGHLEHVQAGAFIEPLSGAEFDAFLADVQRHVDASDLIMLKVWRPDGMLLYSTTGLGVGNSREVDGHFREATQGAPFSGIEETDAEVAGEEAFGRALEIYLPVRGPNGEISNVLELYYSLDSLNGAISSMRLTLLGFLLFLFAAVACIGQLGSRLLVRRNEQLAEMAKKLARLAECDSLTGVANHRHFHDVLQRQLKASNRHGRRLSLVMIDLDFFKRINDTYGHQTGDIVLQETAAAVIASVRAVDVVARYGGEEFAILMPDTPESEAVEAAKRLQSVIRDIAVAAGSERIAVTASFGVAEFPSAALDADSLISAADSSLYLSKKQGRDRVYAFSTLAPGSVDDVDVDHLYHRLRHAGVFTMQSMAATVTGQIPGLDDHSAPTRLARLAGKALQLPEGEQEALALAASVYHVGKLTASEASPSDVEAITTDQEEALRVHPEASEKIIAAVGDLERILKVVRHHHEHYDGSGYPEGLKGDQIPYLARVLSVIDAFSAMTSGPAEGDSLSSSQALAELRKNAGTRFDPGVVERLAATVLSDVQQRERAA